MNNVPHQTRRAAAFTIMELIVAIVIIGVLAAIALPSYKIQMLKMKNQEAIRVLMTLWEAQKDYHRENGVYTSNIADLAIDIPASKNFNAPVLYDQILGGPAVVCPGPDGGSSKVLALMFFKYSPSFSFWALENGRIACSSFEPFLCDRMGFKCDW